MKSVKYTKALKLVYRELKTIRRFKTLIKAQNFSTMPYFGIILLNSQGYNNTFFKYRF